MHSLAPPTASHAIDFLAAHDLCPKAVVVWFEAITQGCDRAEAERAALSASSLDRGHATRRFFDVAWGSTPFARERARDVVAAWFERHRDSGHFFVADAVVCISVNASYAAALAADLRALDRDGAIARVDGDGPVSRAAFAPARPQSLRPTLQHLPAAA